MFCNRNGQSFYHEQSGEWFEKNTKFWVGIYSGFGIDARLLEEQVLDYGRNGVDFVVRKDLKDFRTGRVVCGAGIYRINVHDIRSYGVWDTLNPRHGEQVFIPAMRCTKIK